MSAAMHYEPFYSLDTISSAELGLFAGRVGFPATEPDENVGGAHCRISVLTAGEPRAPLGQNAVDICIAGAGSGASAVGRAYAHDGDKALSLFDGSFSGLIVDLLRGRALLFNDRYGMERLFIHSDGQRTFFASEAKAILAVAPRTREFDSKGLAEFLACGCTLGSQSLFRNIAVLAGGTTIVFAAGEPAVHRAYFDRSVLENVEPVSEAEFIEGLKDRLWSSVEAAVRNPPSVGISLTGGLDSRMIMACLDAPAGTVPCYTFGSMYRDTYDVSVGREVARWCGQPHKVLQLGPGFLVDARRTLEQSSYISDGYIGFSGAAELYLNRRAREIAPVRMTGNWGGELLRGVRAFKYHVPKGGFLTPVLAHALEESAAVFSGAAAVHPLSYTLFHHMPALGYGRYAVERSQVTMRTPFLGTELVEWLYRAPTSARRASDAASAHVIRRRPELLAIPTDFGLLGTDSGAVRSLRRWARKGLFKAEYLASHGAPDWFAALSASFTGGLIERPFLGLHKFQHFRSWFREELAGVLRETLVNGRQGELDAWFDMRRVRVMVEAHIRGRANYTDEIDKLVTVANTGRLLLQPSENHLAVAAGGR
jgi:asparagine synthase (glutamine-hydrolysing)